MSTLEFPPAPAELSGPVKAWHASVVIPTYEPAEAQRLPMFVEQRVYQGSTGRVYPLPSIDRVSTNKTDRTWDVICMENDFLRVMLIPQIGGRIHQIQCRKTGYDLVYKQDVIKPALVGLAGPWISGGIEFNWPQHHRPSTFMPADVHIEPHPDGSVTVWMSEHDPMLRMKGMHGVCLHPDRAYVQLKARLFNRTQLPQTFLWWANVATRVHEQYQSFFPPDVYYVADHAKRATSRYPHCEGFYYGVDYGTRGRKGVPAHEMPRQFVPPGSYKPNDLSYYANIPTPCSYMCMGSKEDFFGGYDYKANAGILHIASHHLSPGKKQWTWGNHEFGYAWDRNLTDADENGVYHPYIEIMAGVFTDNQPDFSFLAPGETRTFSQYWYPIHQIGPATHANLDAAVSLKFDGQTIRVGVCVSRVLDEAQLRILCDGTPIFDEWIRLAPGEPLVREIAMPKGRKESDLRLELRDRDGASVISYQPRKINRNQPVPSPATETPEPKAVSSSDELFTMGLHLEQYRHATRCPTLYWREALRRDPGDARCNNAMGRWHLLRGEFDLAEKHFRAAIERITSRNPNPYDGEPYYNLGVTLRYRARQDSVVASGAKAATEMQLLSHAYDAFYKSTWNAAWQAPAYQALAEIDCCRGDWLVALDHLNQSLKHNVDNTKARNLRAMVLCRLGKREDAHQQIEQTLAADPLDFWAHFLKGQSLACDAQVRIDIAIDLSRAGFFAEAIDLLATFAPSSTSGAAPMVQYFIADLAEQMNLADEAASHRAQAMAAPSAYCFPSRLEEMLVLQRAIACNKNDARAREYLGHLLYDKGRRSEAVGLWQQSARIDPRSAVVWRNVGIGAFNILQKPALAKQAYERAMKLEPRNARLLYERDELAKRLGESPRSRLKRLKSPIEQVKERDDLCVELARLYNLTDQPLKALAVLESRTFQPWEGGEGGALSQHAAAHIALGQLAIGANDPTSAVKHFEQAMSCAHNLGEAWHLLQNLSHIHYHLGEALALAGDARRAKEHWKLSGEFKGDFQTMSVRAFSEMTYFSALSLRRLGRSKDAGRLLRDLLAYAKKLQKSQAGIDYFATSLPFVPLFNADLQQMQSNTARFMQAQALVGLGKRAAARQLLAQVLKADPSHALANELLTSL